MHSYVIIFVTVCVCKCVNNAGKDDSLAKVDGGMTHAKMLEGIEGRGHHACICT